MYARRFVFGGKKRKKKYKNKEIFTRKTQRVLFPL